MKNPSLSPVAQANPPQRTPRRSGGNQAAGLLCRPVLDSNGNVILGGTFDTVRQGLAQTIGGTPLKRKILPSLVMPGIIVFVSSALECCTHQPFAQGPEFYAAAIDEHQRDTDWLRRVVETQKLASPLELKCAFYLMVQECRFGKTVSEVGKKAIAPYWLDSSVCTVAAVSPILGGQAIPVSGAWVGIISLAPSETERYSICVGLSEVISADDLYFALGHPDSALSQRIHFVCVHCIDKDGRVVMHSEEYKPHRVDIDVAP